MKAVSRMKIGNRTTRSIACLCVSGLWCVLPSEGDEGTVVGTSNGLDGDNNGVDDTWSDLRLDEEFGSDAGGVNSLQKRTK